MKQGEAEASRVTCAEPSSRSTRTSTSVSVALSPSMRTAEPLSPPAQFTLHCSVYEPLANEARGGARLEQASGSCTYRLRRMLSPTAGTFQKISYVSAPV